MRKQVLLLLIVMLSVVPLLPAGAAQRDAVTQTRDQPTRAQVFALMRQMKTLYEAGKYREVLTLLKRVDSYGGKKPNELLLLEANVYAKTGNAIRARTAIKQYLASASPNDQHYAQAKVLEKMLNQAIGRQIVSRVKDAMSRGTTTTADGVDELTDTTPPTILLNRGLAVVNKAEYVVAGAAEDASGIAIVEVNGIDTGFDESGAFSVPVLLKLGQNTVTIVATDVRFNQTTETLVVTREQVAAMPKPAVWTDDDDKEETIAPASIGAFYALLVGVEDYRDDSLNDLYRPINDAEAIASVLTEHYTFDADKVIILRDPTRAELIGTLDGLSRRVTDDDNLVIFYAGHGYWDEKFEQGCWLLSDATQSTREAWIANGTIRDYIRGIPSRHTLLVSDACFSGGIFRTRSAFNDASMAIKKLYELTSRKAMTSGTLTEVPDRSVFIEYMLRRLKENDETYLSSEQLFASFRTAVINNSPLEQVPQFGEIREAGDEGGDFIFVRRQP